MMTGTVCLEEKTISIQNFGIWGLMGARGKICRRKCYIWNRRTWFAYSLCNFYGATMMIEGSLLLFIFGQKMEVPFWAKIWRFWGLNRGLKLNLSVITSKRPAKWNHLHVEESCGFQWRDVDAATPEFPQDLHNTSSRVLSPPGGVLISLS